MWSKREGSAEPARHKRDESEAKQAVEGKREREGEGVCVVGAGGVMGGELQLSLWIFES